LDDIIGVIRSNIMPFLGVLVLLSVSFVGAKLILNANKPENRSAYVSSVAYVFAGAAVLGLLIPLSGMLYGMLKNVLPEAGGNFYGYGGGAPRNIPEANGSWIVNIITQPLAYVLDGIRYLINLIYGMFFGGYGNQGGPEFNLTELLYSSNSVWFPDSVLKTLDGIMFFLAVAMFPILIISIAKLGVQYTTAPFSLKTREEANENLARWFVSILFVVFAPFFVRALLQTNEIMLNALKGLWRGESGLNMNILDSIKTGYNLLDAIIKLFFCFCMIRILIMFVIRKITVMVYYVFTPIASYLWTISKNINSASIWFGEMLSNIFMQFFYAFTFTLYSLLASQSGNWIEALVWMFLIVPIGEALRNSLQGLITRLSGVDESRLAGGIAGGLVGLGGMMASGLKGAKTAFSGPGGADIGPDGVYVPPKRNNTDEYKKDIGDTRSRSIGITYDGNPGSPNDFGTPPPPPDSGNNNPNNPPIDEYTVLSARYKMMHGISVTNKISNAVGKVLGTTMAIAAVPLGADSARAASNFGMFVGGGVRALGTMISAEMGAGIIRKETSKYSPEKRKELGIDNPDTILFNAESDKEASDRRSKVLNENIKGGNELNSYYKKYYSMIRWKFPPLGIDNR